MYIGYMGTVVFIVSSDYMITPTDFKRGGEARWATHDLILRKPASEFTGPGLETVSFKIILSADHGISPLAQLRILRQMRDTGAVFPVVIGGRPLSQNMWRLNSLSEEDNYYTSTGLLQQSSASVSLTEYDDSNTAEENTLAGMIYSIFAGAI